MTSECFPGWIPPAIIEYYKEQGVESLFDWQRAILEDDSCRDQHVVFSAPTSAGKSIVAELLALPSAVSGRKVLFVLPYISVATEKLFQIQRCWRRVDINVCGFIGPNSVAPNEWTAAVCTIEKAVSLLNRALADSWFHEIGTVIIDELHMIFDNSRGKNIENMLAKILYYNKSSSEKVRIIAMSATVPQIHNIGAWLGAKVFEADFRPIEIDEKFVWNGQVRKFRENTVGATIRCFKKDADPLLTIAMDGYRDGKQTLVFCSSKAECEKIALEIAKNLAGMLQNDDAMKKLIEEKRDGLLETKAKLEKVGCVDKLMLLTLARAVCFHHAGLTIEERESIESAFRAGYIVILVATSTLASGVNLPAERVIVKAQTRGPSAITAMTYRQMVGRAGRTGFCQKGESYVIAKKGEEEKVLELICRQKIEDRSQSNRDASRLFLESICTGLTSARSHVVDLVECLLNRENCDVDESLNKLETNSFVTKTFDDDDNDNLSPTQLGRATLASSLPPEAALFIFEDLHTAMKSIALDTELHMLYLVTPVNVSVWQDCDWNHLFSLFSKTSQEHRRVAKLVGVSEKFLLERLRGNWKAANDQKLQVHVRFFSCLALFDLINETPLHEVSDKYRISRGCLQTLQLQSATYAAMIVAFCSRLGWLYLKSLLDDFAMRLHFGIRKELSELVAVDGIDGHRARVLHTNGMTCLSQIVNCDLKKLAQILTLAVPFEKPISSKNDDGKREWLFGEKCMELNEAAMELKKRAKIIIMQKVRDLGISIDFGKMEKDIGFEVEEAKNEDIVEKKDNDSQFSCDSGVGSMHGTENSSNRCSTSQEIEKEDLDEFSRTMQDLSLVEDSENNDDCTTAIEGDVFDFCDDVKEESLDSLETSLLKVQPPTTEEFYRRLSDVYSNPGTPKNKIIERTVTKKSICEDSFDNSIVFNKTRRSSVLQKSLIEENKENDVGIFIGKESRNSSFDVFETPPSVAKKICHKRTAALTSRYPYSPTVASPLQKITRNDFSQLMVEDFCRTEKSWQMFCKSFSSCGSVGLRLAREKNRDVIGVAMTNLRSGETAYLPLTDRLLPVDQCGICLGRPSIDQSVRISALSQILACTTAYIYSLQTCYDLKRLFDVEIIDPVCLSVLYHAINEDENLENMTSTMIKKLDWDFDVEEYVQSGPILSALIYSLAAKRIYDEVHEAANQVSSAQSVNLELDSVKVVCRMFFSGVPFDTSLAARAVASLRRKCEQLENECWLLAKQQFSLDSSQQVANVLFHKLHLVHPGGSQKTASKHLLTNKNVLSQMSQQHEIVGKILLFRHIKHVITQCMIPLCRSADDVTQRIRCDFEVCTATGRILTSHPNIQNVPKKESIDGFCARQLFAPQHGNVLIGADYSQLELRVLAHLSADEKLLSLFKEERDLFSELSTSWGYGRDAIKQLCYGLIYGMGIQSLAELTKLDVSQAERLWKNFFVTFPKVQTYIAETKQNAYKNGFVTTLLGRKRMTKILKGSEKGHEERVLVNYTIQGTASEIFKTAIVEIEKSIRDKQARIVMTVHDEVLIECSSKTVSIVSDVVRRSMQNSLAHLLRVPLRVSLNVAESWAKLK